MQTQPTDSYPELTDDTIGSEFLDQVASMMQNGDSQLAAFALHGSTTAQQNLIGGR